MKLGQVLKMAREISGKTLRDKDIIEQLREDCPCSEYNDSDEQSTAGEKT